MTTNMATFIEQKKQLRQQIAELERANERMWNEIDDNEQKIAEMRFRLEQIGTPAGRES